MRARFCLLLCICSLVYVCVFASHFSNQHTSHMTETVWSSGNKGFIIPFSTSLTCRGLGRHPTHGCCWWAASGAGCDRRGQSASTCDPEALAASLYPVRKNLLQSQAGEDGNEGNNWTTLVAQCLKLSNSTSSNSMDLFEWGAPASELPHWPLPRLQPSLGCLSCSRTAVWCSGGQPRCSCPHTGPALPSPSNPEIELEMTKSKTFFNVPLVCNYSPSLKCTGSIDSRIYIAPWWCILTKIPQHSGKEYLGIFILLICDYMFIFLILVLLSTIFSSTKRLSPTTCIYFVQYSQIFILLHVGYNTPNWSVYNITTGWRSNRVIFFSHFFTHFFFPDFYFYLI